MKHIILAITFLIAFNFVFSQNKSRSVLSGCFLLDTVKNDLSKIDSFSIRLYAGAKINFVNKRDVKIYWSKYFISGTYNIDNITKRVILKFKRRSFNYYENGTIERAKFATLLLQLQNKIIVLDDGTIAYKSNEGIKREVYFSSCIKK